MIFLCDAKTCEPGGALLAGGGGLAREPEETEDALTARAEAGAAQLVRLQSRIFGGIRDALEEEWGEVILRFPYLLIT